MISPLASSIVLPCSRGQHLGQLVHVLVQQLNELHEHAGAALRIGGGPFRLRGLGVFDGGIQFGVAGQRNLGLNFAGCRIEDVGCCGRWCQRHACRR